MSLSRTDEHIFKTREDFIAYLDEKLKEAGEDNELGRELASRVATDFETYDEGEARPRRQRGLILRNRRWVIRNDDLSLLKSISDGLKSAAAAGFFVHLDPLTGTGAAVSSLVGIAVSVAQVARQVIKKGATLSKNEINVLCLVRAYQSGVRVPELVQALNRTTSLTDGIWTEERVQKELQRLEKVVLQDGSIESLVGQDSNGFWSASGV